MAAPKGETALQRETRLTGNAELVSAIDSTLQVLAGMRSNLVLSRKVIGRWCQSKTPAEFKDKVPVMSHYGGTACHTSRATCHTRRESEARKRLESDRNRQVRDYMGNMEDTVLLGFFMTIQKRVEMLDSAPAGPETLGASLPTEGGILRREGGLTLTLTLTALAP